MTKPTIDDLLMQSAPPSGLAEPRVQSALHAIAAESRATAKATHNHLGRRLWWLAVPLITVPAVAFAITAGTEPRMVPDFTIPISYTIDTGQAVTCSIDLFNGEIDYVETNTEAVDYFRAQDWTGIGQRIYQAALVYENDDAWVRSETHSDSPSDILSPSTIRLRNKATRIADRGNAPLKVPGRQVGRGVPQP